MKILNLDIAKEIVIHGYSDDEIIPLLLFKGNLDINKAKSLYKISLMMMEAEVPSLARIRDVTSNARDLLHMTGLHDFSQYGLNMNSFFARCFYCPEIIKLNPSLKEYIHWVDTNTSGSFLWRKLKPIDRYASRTRRDWRYQPDKSSEENKLNRQNLKIKKQIEKDNHIEIPQFYPFFTEKPNEEHELLEWVHHLVPKSLPDYWRQDVCQDLIVEVLCGNITRDNATSKVKKYISKTFKDYPTLYGPMSLDAPLGHDGDDSFTLLDVIEDEHSHIY